jgi:hypothetical protein
MDELTAQICVLITSVKLTFVSPLGKTFAYWDESTNSPYLSHGNLSKDCLNPEHALLSAPAMSAHGHDADAGESVPHVFTKKSVIPEIALGEKLAAGGRGQPSGHSKDPGFV